MPTITVDLTEAASVLATGMAIFLILLGWSYLSDARDNQLQASRADEYNHEGGEVRTHHPADSHVVPEFGHMQERKQKILAREHARMARELYEQLSRTEHTVNRERFESIVTDHIERALLATLPAPEQGWRPEWGLLDDSDALQDGDEFRTIFGTWIPITIIEKTACEYGHTIFRRRLAAPRAAQEQERREK